MRFVARRVATFLASLLAASLVVFAVMAVLPGDPATVAAGTEATPEQVQALRQEFGLDAPAPERYADWIGGLVTGDLGETFLGGRSITTEIGSRLPVTLPLAALGMVLAVLVAVPLGVLAALGHRRTSGTVISAVSQLGIAFPAFWAGIILSTVVGVRLGWLPANGWVPGASGWSVWTEEPWEAFQRLILPAVSLALVQSAILTRYVRSAVLEVLREDWLRTARAKGLTRAQALRRHGLRNAAIPVVTVLGLQLAAVVVGAVVVENVFTLPGLGSKLIDGINNREVVLVQDIVMLLTVVALVVNLLVDLAYVVIDPRLRHR